MKLTSTKTRKPSSQKVFDRLGDVLTARGYEKTPAPGRYYWCWRISEVFLLYVWDGPLGCNKLFIDGDLADLAHALGALKGVIASRDGVTKNRKFEGFSAKKVNPYTGVTEYEGWRFQFADEAGANKFLDVCEEFERAGIEAACAKAQNFEQLPVRSTSRSRVVVARVGQNDFRKALLRYWKACAVTGCKVTAVLRASHIKPWAACDAEERLDSLNGLLLSANLDALFDAGLITFKNSGEMVISSQLSVDAWSALGLSSTMRLRKVNTAHAPYLTYHRNNVYKK